MDLLQQMSRTAEWVRSVYPMITRTAEEYTMPPHPPRPDLAAAEALSAYWSDAVARLVADWRDALDQVERDGIMITVGRDSVSQSQGTGGIDIATATKDLLTHKADVQAAEDAVRLQVRNELIAVL